MRRELWHLVTELLDAAPALPAGDAEIRVTGMTLDLPAEIALPRTSVGFRLYADAPRTQWSYGLRARPGRLRVVLQQAPAGTITPSDTRNPQHPS